MSSSNSNINHRGHQLLHHNSQEVRHRTSSSISSSGKNDASSLFIEDRRGDRRNVEFAAPDRYAVPRYYTVGGGALIGLGPNYRMISKSDTRREVQNIGLDSGRKSRKQSLLAGLTEDDDSLIKVHSSPSQDDDLQRDFLRFSHGRPRKRRRFSNDLGGSASSAESASDSSDGERRQREKPEQDTFDAFKNDPVHRRHMELSRATSERPQDVNAWLTFIKYQEISFSARREHRSTHSAATSRSLADLRISLYEQALSHVKDPAGRHALILGLMQEGSTIWDVQKQASQWQVFLDKDSSYDLWILYLNFMQSSALKFNLDTCLQVYKRCLTKFSSSGHDGPLRDSQCVYLLLRLTLLLWQSGFTERALGVWQAMIEFNLFRPSQLSTDMVMSAFEQFWSSEVPRVGEDGATGWCSNSNTEPEPKVDKQPPEVAVHNLTTWARAETDLEKHASLPARALDDVPDDDPYRILLFSDIQDFVFSIESKQGFELLRDAFLLFLGLPPCHLLLHEPRQWKEDPFIYTPSLAVSNPDISTRTHADTTTVVATSLHDVFGTVKSSMASSDSNTMPSPSSSSKRPVHVVLDFVRRAVSQTARVASKNATPDEDMMEYAIALEAGIDFKSARKQAKSFLKKNPDSLRLYNVYALVENEVAGNFDAAEKVWSTALSMRQPDLPFGNQRRDRDTLMLWRDWVFSSMKRKRFQHARTLLSMITDKPFDLDRFRQAETSEDITHMPSAANQVKTERYLRLEFSACRVSREGRMLLSVVADLLALHKYLYGTLRLGDAMEAYRDLLQEVKLNETEEMDTVSEKIHQGRAQFVHAHSAVYAQPYRPRESWQVIADSTRLFPNNRTLLTLHHYFSQKSGLVDRLRQVDIDADTTTPADGVEAVTAEAATIPPRRGEENKVTSVEFNLEVELNRPSYAGSTDHSIRAAFRRATDQNSPGFHCIDIWKSYIKWESSLRSLVVGLDVLEDDEEQQQHKKKKHAQQTRQHQNQQQQKQRLTNLTGAFYAAIRACPWSKELYMVAFADDYLVAALGNDDGLKRLHESMMDRGLRLRTNIS
ncbi:hypothetical protein LTS17_000309 [Exophiala oligosperma]